LQNQIGKIKNPTSQDESGVLFQINHVDPPLRVKGAGTELIGFNIQRKFGDVNDKKSSGLRVPCFAFQATQGRQGSEVK
jgi:hypothetical protein